MSNLKDNFTSKLASVTVTEKKGSYIYTATFENGEHAVIRTSGRKYVSVTQIRTNNHYAKDETGTWNKVDRTDFLFSAKLTPALGKNELHRVVATVLVNTGASAPVVAPLEAKSEIDWKSLTTPAGTVAPWSQEEEFAYIDAQAKAQAAPVKGEKQFTHNDVAFSIAPDFKGTHGWRWYIGGVRSNRAYLCEERAIFEAKLHIDNYTGASAPVLSDRELAKYQPKIVTDAIDNALAQEQHRLEHSGDGDCDREERWAP